MAHYAEIQSGLVTNVIVAEADYIATLSGQWVQTSYNTVGGVHYGPDRQPDGGTPLRMNYAGVGYTYDPVLDIFYAPSPQPAADFELDTTTYLWKRKPVPVTSPAPAPGP
jgi:hypothetical protein